MLAKNAELHLKNIWYCAGWDDSLSLGRDAILSKKIANEDIVIYRKPNGGLVAMEDRCCHRQAALSCGRKEGADIRCMYHGWKFSPEGKCIEIPGQERIPERARIRTFPVVTKNDWIWVWFGEPKKADENLICHSVGPSNPAWHTKTSHLVVEANIRQEIANLADLTHIAWTHMDTFGGTRVYSSTKGDFELTDNGGIADMWLRSVPAPKFAQHLFDEGALMDLHFYVTYTLPCNFNMHFRVFTAGSNTEGESKGDLILDSFTSQSITPRDADCVDYYYAWGAVKDSTPPGFVPLLIEAIDEAFLEDKRMLEAQHRNIKSKPEYKQVDYQHDGGPAKLLWLLDKKLQAENPAA